MGLYVAAAPSEFTLPPPPPPPPHAERIDDSNDEDRESRKSSESYEGASVQDTAEQGEVPASSSEVSPEL